MSENSDVVSLNDGDFDGFIKENDLVVVDFWATWCSPCMAMNPVVQEIAEEYSGDIKFAKVNVEENPSLASRFGISSIPAFIFFKKGSPCHQAKGMLNKDIFRDEISSAYNL